MAELPGKSEGKEAPKGLMSLFTRPKKFYENVTSGTVQMTAAISEMVYIRACSDCELRATTKLAKCIIESCFNIKVALEEPIMSGTLELIDCKNVSVFINPRDSLPTITTERCQTLHFHLVKPESMGSIYTVGCQDVTVHFKPPHPEENVLELPGQSGEGGGDSEQFVSYRSGENIITEKVVREGAGYATTASKLAEAEKKQKELMKRFEEHVVKMLNLPPPPPTSSSTQPTSQSTTDPPPADGGASESTTSENQRTE